jgi:hypothetical protein
MWKEYTNAVLGLCVVAVAFLGLSGAAFAWTVGILGALVLVLGLWGASMTSGWQDYLSAFLGFCVLTVAFLGLSGATLAWTLVILGAVILILELWEAGTAPSSDLSSQGFRKSHA